MVLSNVLPQACHSMAWDPWMQNCLSLMLTNAAVVMFLGLKYLLLNIPIYIPRLALKDGNTLDPPCFILCVRLLHFSITIGLQDTQMAKLVDHSTIPLGTF